MQQMKRDGVQPDIHTYTSFINACCRAGDMQVNYLFSQKILFVECLFYLITFFMFWMPD